MSESGGVLDVLIIGGGPAGLSVGKALSRRGISLLILERDKVGWTWQRVPCDMQVLSPWWTNSLDVKSAFGCNPFSRVAASRFKAHLSDFAAGLGLIEGAEVSSVERHGDKWSIGTRNHGVWFARNVVCATGYYSSPYIPYGSFSSDGSVPHVHASAVENYDEFAARLRGKRVMVVGKRVTAGQLIVELCHREVEIVLSATSPIEFHRSGVLGEVLDQLYFFYEAVKIRARPNLRGDSFAKMNGGEAQRLIDSGVVRVVPRIVAVSGGRAGLEGGGKEVVDAVVFATGYRPTLDYLDGLVEMSPVSGLPDTLDFEVQGAPGLFLIGFDNLVNFRSRYLRGIRSDAKKLAGILTARLGRSIR